MTCTRLPGSSRRCTLLDRSSIHAALLRPLRAPLRPSTPPRRQRCRRYPVVGAAGRGVVGEALPRQSGCRPRLPWLRPDLVLVVGTWTPCSLLPVSTVCRGTWLSGRLRSIRRHGWVSVLTGRVTSVAECAETAFALITAALLGHGGCRTLCRCVACTVERRRCSWTSMACCIPTMLDSAMVCALPG